MGPQQGFRDTAPGPLCGPYAVLHISEQCNLPPRSRKASASPALMSVRSRHPEAEALCFERGSTGLLLRMGDQEPRPWHGGRGGSLLPMPVQRVSAPHLGAASPSFKSGGREVVASPARAAGPCSKSWGREVVAPPAGAEGRCFTCRCSGSLLRMPGQRESRCGGEVVYCTASRCGARHRARMSTSFSGCLLYTSDAADE